MRGFFVWKVVFFILSFVHLGFVLFFFSFCFGTVDDGGDLCFLKRERKRGVRRE